MLWWRVHERIRVVDWPRNRASRSADPLRIPCVEKRSACHEIERVCDDTGGFRATRHSRPIVEFHSARATATQEICESFIMLPPVIARAYVDLKGPSLTKIRLTRRQGFGTLAKHAINIFAPPSPDRSCQVI